MKYDFSGYATKNDIKCSDGRVIRHNAFKNCDGKTIPLVWQHLHGTPDNILGHALLENRNDGVYAYCKFNESDSAKSAKEAVKHGDITGLSIHANNLKQQGSNVIHGIIREVSLVVAGANSGALIDNLNFSHADGYSEVDETEAIIYTGLTLMLEENNVIHADKDEEDPKKEEPKKEETKDTNSEDKTVAEVFDTLNEEQKKVVYYMVSTALDESTSNDDGEEKDDDKNKGGTEIMKHNVFETDKEEKKDGLEALTHSEMLDILSTAKTHGTLKHAFLAHGITNIEYLFPEAKNITNTPYSLAREMGWVGKVMSGVHKTPFSRIKSLIADLTEDEARAKGYIKGKMKKEEVFALLKRTTTPQTIYKKQKLDRDDVIDITDFDVIAWLKAEMRMMLEEEIARAILIGDGRNPSSDDKINEQNIRPIWTDDDLYTIKQTIPAITDDDKRVRAFIRAAVKARKEYKGSGAPTLYTTEDVITDCLLMEDTTGRIIYESIDKLKNVLRVSDIVSVPVMEGSTRTNTEGVEVELKGIITNLTDYNIGADKGGAVNMFDDFDIDYNAMKYLIETRCSGAMVKPLSAIALEQELEAVSG